MTAELSLPLLIGLITVALAFDFLNGLHDTANSIATIVSTRMLRPRYAVIWAAFFNFIAFLALVLILGVSWALVRANPGSVEPTFQWLQFAAASLISLGHGGNDAQKTMGIIAVLLFSQGRLGSNFYVPFWVVLICQATIGLGTLVGGWRIVRTVGSKITRMTPVQGCCVSAGGAIILFAATFLGIPVSTTHTVTGSVVGVGAARKVSAVRWNVASNIVTAWIITLPASASMAALCYLLSKAFG